MASFKAAVTSAHVAVFTMECAAGNRCTLFNIPMEHYPDTGKPRHICMHCRKGIHAPCTLQCADEHEKVSRFILSPYHRYTKLVKWRLQV